MSLIRKVELLLFLGCQQLLIASSGVYMKLSGNNAAGAGPDPLGEMSVSH